MIEEIQKKEQNLEYKNFKIKAKTEEEGIIEAYVSVFGNRDAYNEIVEKGAFKDSLKKKLPKGVWAHNWDQPIAKTLEAEEDDKGLRIKGKLIMEVQKAREAYALMKEGVIDEFSIGYRVIKDEYDKETGTRILKKVELYEWSPVLVGANSETELLNIKDGKKKLEKTETCKECKEGIIEMKPYENEHSCRLEDPNKYEKFARKNCAAKHEGKCIDHIYGIKEGKSELQAMRFNKDVWTESDARNYCKEHKGTFEAASKNEEKEGRVLSEKNRELVKNVISQMEKLLIPLKQLVEATNPNQTEEGEKGRAEPDDKNKIIRIKQATKEIDKNAEFILRIVKK